MIERYHQHIDLCKYFLGKNLVLGHNISRHLQDIFFGILPYSLFVHFNEVVDSPKHVYKVLEPFQLKSIPKYDLYTTLKLSYQVSL